MKIESSDKTIGKIFNSTYIKIPRFQRPFCWEKEEIDDFMNDIIFSDDQDYFVGSMVLYKSGSGDYLSVVDGQQRLTTSTLILCAIRNIFNEINEDKLALGIQRLIERENISFEKEFVLQTESSFPFFQEHIQKNGKPELDGNNSPEEEYLKNGFIQIYTKLKKKIEYDKFIKSIISKEILTTKLQQYRDKLLATKTIFIELDSESDAYIIFETLNTRGKELEADHLIKNYIMKGFSKSTSSVDVALEKWKYISKHVQKNNYTLSDFIYHHWLSNQQKYTTSKKLYKSVLDNIDNEDKIKIYLDSLYFSSNQYEWIIDTRSIVYDKSINEIRSSLDYLNSLKVKVHIPMTLAVLDNWKKKKIKYKIARNLLSEIELFHYAFTGICSKRTSGTISTMYSSAAIELNNANTDIDINKVIMKFKKALRAKYPLESEFVNGLNNLWFTNDNDSDKKTIIYTLMLYQKFKQPIDKNFLSIEHLIPQAKYENYPNVGCIGNLLLVDNETNYELDTKIFQEKKIILKNKDYIKDDYLNKISDLTKENIDTRTKEIAKAIYKKIV